MRKRPALDADIRDMMGLPATLPAGYRSGPTPARRTARPRRPPKPPPALEFRGVDEPTPTLPPCSCTVRRLAGCVRHNRFRVRRMPPITLEPAGPLVLTLPFPRPPITANEARAGDTGHWSTQSKAKERVHDAVGDAVESQESLPVFDRCAVELTWHADDNGRRDPDGLAPFLKACLDGLKLSGVIEDDHAGIVDYVAMRIRLASPPARMVLRVLPV